MVLLMRKWLKIISFFRLLILILFRSTCHLEYEACTKHLDIKPFHMGQCNNCHNITCPFNGQCRSEQGNYTCICPTRDTCPPLPPVRVCFFFSFCMIWFDQISLKKISCWIKKKDRISIMISMSFYVIFLI